MKFRETPSLRGDFKGGIWPFLLSGETNARKSRRWHEDPVHALLLAVRLGESIVSWYDIFKLLHVLTAIAWVGGGVVLFVLGISAQRRNDAAVLAQVASHSAYLGLRWFLPASLLTLVFGAIAATLGGLWGDAWVVLGLLGFAGTFLIGLLIIKPTSERAEKMTTTGNIPEAQVAGARILHVSKFDYTLLALVVADMVLKPAWSDVVTLGAMAAVLVIAGVLFLPAVARSKAS